MLMDICIGICSDGMLLSDLGIWKIYFQYPIVVTLEEENLIIRIFLQSQSAPEQVQQRISWCQGHHPQPLWEDPSPEENGINLLTLDLRGSIAFLEQKLKRLPHPFKDQCKNYGILSQIKIRSLTYSNNFNRDSLRLKLARYRSTILQARFRQFSFTTH
ncbi:hypothetical protein JTE90_025389 [Oedothorax gibbosus]|uniref:Uncharacterized protein n=1 Tax=Oedothorax gibbosus TaxID=931172 RepID=A0AAV6TMX1_9ARAC|nr:hypothetical protein JTE90_025389 [Oedothorax gibbosus]